MCMIKTVSATNLRNNLKDAMDHVKESRKPLVITERDIPTAVLLDIDEYEDVLSVKDEALKKSIVRARNDYKKGKVFDMNDVFGGL